MLKESANRTRQILLSLAICVVLGVAGFALHRAGRAETRESSPPTDAGAIRVSPTGQRVVKIATETVRLQALPGVIHATGQVAFPADQTVKISPRLAGRIKAVFVRVGDHVTPGQTLALLDSVDAANAITTARQAENKRRLAQTTLERQERLYQLGTPDVTSAQASLDQARAGALAAKDALERTRHQASIGGFTQKPLEDARSALVAARSTLAQAQSDLSQAQRDHDRKVKLVEVGVASRSDLEASENVLEKARVTVAAGQESVALAEQALEREQKAFQSNLYADQQVRQAEAASRQAALQQEASERALRLAKAQILRDLQQARSDLQAARADADNAQRVLTLLGHPEADGSVRITAPMAGIVTERNVSPGQVVDQSQMTPWQMFVLNNNAVVWVDADVYEKDIARVRSGQQVEIDVSALAGEVFHGVVRHIAPALDPRTRAVKVRAEIVNPGGRLKDGMYASMTVHTGQSKPQTVVVLSAVQHEGDTDYVYVAEARGYVRRTVRLGAQKDGVYVVEQGLKPGERVVVHGAMFLGEQAGSG
jgi:cobalt-zinc-cadmium efflux system membrane fusion protein